MIPREATSPKTARYHLDRLREHLAWLEGRIAAKEAAGSPAGFERAEAEALTWAVEVCETEWDVLVRRQKERAG